MPSSRAIWAIGRPLVRTKSTASRLNSAVNWRPFLGYLSSMGHPPLKGNVLPQGSPRRPAFVSLAGLKRRPTSAPCRVAWLPGAGDLFVTSTGGRNVRAGHLVGTGLSFSEARERMGGITWRAPPPSRASAMPCPRSPSAGSSDRPTSDSCGSCTPWSPTTAPPALEHVVRQRCMNHHPLGPTGPIQCQLAVACWLTAPIRSNAYLLMI
jgi:hypothetical protein